MTEVKETIRNTLINDSEYISLMGNPGADHYRTYYFRPPERPIFPETVIAFQDESGNEEMPEEILSSEIPCVINVWSRDDDYEQIAERIVQLFHQEVQTEQGFRMIMAQDPQEIYDPDFNVYGKSLLFNIFFRRSNE